MSGVRTRHRKTRLSNGGIRLRLLQAGDLALFTRLYADARVMRHVGEPLQKRAVRKAFDHVMQRQAAHPADPEYWVVLKDDADTPLGLVSAQKRDDGSRELGILLLPEAQGGWVAVSALRQVLQRLLRLHPDARIFGRHHPDNRAAPAAMVRLGFARAPELQADGRVRWDWPHRPDATHPHPEQRKGSLSCVGLGMMLGAHLSPRARGCIEQADVVFAAVSDALVELWLQELRPDLRSLQPYYGDGSAQGKPREQTYLEMEAAMLDEVRAGKQVCGVFYGHPGVFAQVPHAAIASARAQGYTAWMEPGISAEDCLYADLGLDPGTRGCMHLEATQFMLYQRTIDTAAWLVLWQIGLTGDRSTRRFQTGAAYLQLLVELLARCGYPASHEVILYEAATLPIHAPRIDRLPLSALPEAVLRVQTTLVLPPATTLRKNRTMIARLAALDAAPARHRTIT